MGWGVGVDGGVLRLHRCSYVYSLRSDLVLSFLLVSIDGPRLSDSTFKVWNFLGFSQECLRCIDVLR